MDDPCARMQDAPSATHFIAGDVISSEFDLSVVLQRGAVGTFFLSGSQDEELCDDHDDGILALVHFSEILSVFTKTGCDKKTSRWEKPKQMR